MAGKGGYQAPANPAPVSGPGELSERTDGQAPMALPDAKYGEQAEFQALQRAAPIDASGITPLDAPTSAPMEPVTDGNPLGPGATSVPLLSPTEDDITRVADMIPMLTILASHPTSSPATRQLVRQLRAGRGHVAQR